nr:Coenzyme F420 hydrogenase/dehydrogenase, beta subunit C-terminal domain [uncultured Butyrivibrio sp.]
MNDELARKTKVIKAYAGYFKNKDKLKKSSSGGIATILAENMINEGGIVYGATYSSDFYSAHYKRAEELCDIDALRGSKYVYVEKKVYINGKAKNVFDVACEDLQNGKKVLFIGLSCDIYSLVNSCDLKKCNKDNLYTIELLCDGVTPITIHDYYVKELESIHSSKVIDFSVRNKRDGWTPLYVYAKFANGEEHVIPFYSSSYGWAFINYKRYGCYKCQFKWRNRYADMTIGDYWGIDSSMEEYNKDGVSIIYVQSENGLNLLKQINSKDFFLLPTDTGFALRHSPRYFNAHPFNTNWNDIDRELKKNGLKSAFRLYGMVQSFNEDYFNSNKEVVIWGAGGCFHKFAPFVIERTDVLCVVDSDQQKWGKIIEMGIKCESPSYIEDKDVFVIIMTEKADISVQIANKLIKMGIYSFDHIENWMKAVQSL